MIPVSPAAPMTLLLLSASWASGVAERPPGLGAAKVAAAVAFIGVVLLLGVAYRHLRRRLEVEDAEALIEAEFDRLDTGEHRAAATAVSSGEAAD